MKILIFTTILFASLSSMAREYGYNPLDKSYIAEVEHLVTNITPIKSQDGVGLCYGFTATTLLEQHRCKELKLNCSDPKNILSSLDVTSYLRNKALKEGGDTYKILSNIQGTDRKVAAEECAKFSTLVHSMTNPKGEIITDEKRGWIFLVKKWNEYKGIGDNGRNVQRNDCVSCLADAIKSTLVNIQTPADQLKRAFLDAGSLNEFLYKAIIPTHCLNANKLLSIPAYTVKTYPAYKETFSEENLAKKIESVLLSDTPLEMGVCVANIIPCPGSEIHSIALVGIKKVCSKKHNNCKLMVKIKNSYGMTWQKSNNNGWVDLDTLVSASARLPHEKNISWIEGASFKLSDKRLIQKNSSSITPAKKAIFTNSSTANDIPAKYKDFKGTWKCPGSNFIDHYEPGCVPLK